MMLNDIGSFSALMLLCWLLLGLLFAAFYSPVSRGLQRLHPRHGSSLLLIYLAGPFLLALIGTAFLFLPDTRVVLVDSHCHENCQIHTPVIQSALLSAMGVLCLLGIFIAAFIKSWSAVRHSLMLHKQFMFLSRQQIGYRIIRTDDPLVFTLGWWNSQVYVGDTILEHCNDKDMAIILSHEQAHQLYKDNLRLLAARIFTAALPQTLAARIRADLADMTEQACDFHAAQQHGYLEVAQVLVKVKRLLLSSGSIAVPAGARGFVESQVENRVRALLNGDTYTKLRQWQLLLSGSGILLILLLIVEPLHHMAEWLFNLIYIANHML